MKKYIMAAMGLWVMSAQAEVPTVPQQTAVAEVQPSNDPMERRIQMQVRARALAENIKDTDPNELGLFHKGPKYRCGDVRRSVLTIANTYAQNVATQERTLAALERNLLAGGKCWRGAKPPQKAMAIPPEADQGN